MKNYIEDFINYLRTEKNCSENTVSAYENDLIQFHNYLVSLFEKNDYDMTDIDHEIIRNYLRNLSLNNIKKTSIGRKITTIRTYFKFLSKRNRVNENPVTNLITPKKEKRLPVFIDEKSITNIMELPNSGEIFGLRDLTMLELFYSTGMRESELLELTLSGLYMSKNMIKVFGKGRKERIIPVGQKAMEVLDKYLKRRTELFSDKTNKEDKRMLFLTNKGKKFYRTGIYNIVKSYLREGYGGKKCSPHVLRHTFATHLLDRGADIESVKQMLGHSSLSTTQIYTHVSVDHLKKIYNKAHPKADIKTK
jgi:tyrosine recombinase XerC